MKHFPMHLLCLSSLFALGLVSCGGGDSSSSTSGSEDFTIDDSGDMLGNGTKENPYVPLNADHWEELEPLITGKEIRYVELKKDLDLTSIRHYEPLGSKAAPVFAHINGNGHTIKYVIDETLKGDRYGLFADFSGVAENLVVDGNIEATSGERGGYCGIFAGEIETPKDYDNPVNTELRYLTVKGKIHMEDNVSSNQDSVSAGGVTGHTYATMGTTVLMDSIDSSVDLLIETTNGCAGGLVGETWTNFNEGYTWFNNSYIHSSSIQAPNLAGGAVGYLYFNGSVVNTIVNVDLVEATFAGETMSVAGGLVGNSGVETAMMHNIVAAKRIKTSRAGAFKDYISAGQILGYTQYEEGGFDMERTSKKSLNRENYYLSSNELSTASTYGYGSGKAIEMKDLKKEFFHTNSFDSYAWDLNEGHFPRRVDVFATWAKNRLQKGTITLHANNGTDEKTVYEVNLGSNLVLKDQPYAYEGHNLIGIAYDENGEDRYRPYMPVNTSMDVYDGWFYSAKYAGYFYGGANMPLFYFNADGTGLAFEDTGFIDTDLTWWSDGSHLVVEGESTGQLFGRLTNQGSEVIQLDFLQTVCNFVHLGSNASIVKEFGYYKSSSGETLFLGGGSGYVQTPKGQSTFTYEKGSDGRYVLTFSENMQFVSGSGTCSGGAASFTFVDSEKKSVSLIFTTDSGIPDYSKLAIAQSYYFYGMNSQMRMDIDNNGNVRYRSRVKESGAYTEEYNDLPADRGSLREIGSYHIVTANYAYVPSGVLTFDEAKGELYNATGRHYANAKTRVVQALSTSETKEADNTYVYALEDGSYRAFIKGKYIVSANIKISSLEEGSRIEIEGKKYLVENSALVDMSTLAEENPNPSKIYGEYIEKAGGAQTSNLLTLGENNKGTLATSSGVQTFSYYYDVNEQVVFHIGKNTYTLIFDPSTSKLSGTRFTDNGFDADSVTTTMVYEKKKAAVTSTMVGEFEGTISGGTVYRFKITKNKAVSFTYGVQTTPINALKVSGELSSNSLTCEFGQLFGGGDGATAVLTYNPDLDQLSVQFSGDLSTNVICNRIAA